MSEHATIAYPSQKYFRHGVDTAELSHKFVDKVDVIDTAAPRAPRALRGTLVVTRCYIPGRGGHLVGARVEAGRYSIHCTCLVGRFEAFIEQTNVPSDVAYPVPPVVVPVPASISDELSSITVALETRGGRL